MAAITLFSWWGEEMKAGWVGGWGGGVGVKGKHSRQRLRLLRVMAQWRGGGR